MQARAQTASHIWPRCPAGGKCTGSHICLLPQHIRGIEAEGSWNITTCGLRPGLQKAEGKNGAARGKALGMALLMDHSNRIHKSLTGHALDGSGQGSGPDAANTTGGQVWGSMLPNMEEEGLEGRGQTSALPSPVLLPCLASLGCGEMSCRSKAHVLYAGFAWHQSSLSATSWLSSCSAHQLFSCLWLGQCMD